MSQFALLLEREPKSIEGRRELIEKTKRAYFHVQRSTPKLLLARLPDLL